MISSIGTQVDSCPEAREGFAAEIAALLVEPGFAYLEPQELTQALHAVAPDVMRDWDRFAASWDRLPRDAFMGDGGLYRYRRHALYAASAGGTARPLPHAPHYQSRDYNALNGGVERWFEPFEPEVAGGCILPALLTVSGAVFGARRPAACWHIEVHQFRIVAESGREGRPTPEGVHRDGVDFVMVMMVQRRNIASGRTDLFASDGRPVSSFTLVEPRAAVMLDDRRLAHGVTPVVPVEPDAPSFRDVLVVTYRDDSMR